MSLLTRLVLVQVLLVMGFGAIVLGCLEYFGRYQREMIRKLLDEVRYLRKEARQQREGLKALVDLLPEEKSQAWHQGYAAAMRDRLTGTDDAPAAGDRDAEVLKLVPRNTEPT